MHRGVDNGIMEKITAIVPWIRWYSVGDELMPGEAIHPRGNKKG